MKTVRCAIYTRKSSEEGLEQAFNSLDAQREACAAYVLSQASEGWAALPIIYDDGGLSGGSLERPALQRLLADVAAGRVDIIVVYKVDRLTRSLLDFAKLVEALDTAGTSFVSVTQSFNTTTSMGRLTLNMLLSFAQFEREVTAERIRDKIAASKAKGMWMGGTPPLGYRPEGRSLAIVEGHAAIVREIFRRYLELGNVRLVAEALARDGVGAPRRQTASGRPFGGGAFTRGQLYAILKNPIYVGDIPHHGKLHKGMHAAIIERATWARAQAQLADHLQGPRRTAPAARPSLLAGLIVDEEGERLVATHASKGRVRYRYYVSRGLQHGIPVDASAAVRMPAREIEAAVTLRVAEALNDPLALAAQAWLVIAPRDFSHVSARSAAAATAVANMDRELVRLLVQKVRLLSGRIEVDIATPALANLLHVRIADGAPASVTLACEVRLTRTGRALRLVQSSGAVVGNASPDRTLVNLVAKARSWWSELRAGESDVPALAGREGVTDSYVTRVVRLAFLSPNIVDAILAGSQPAAINGGKLTAPDAIGVSWTEQCAIFDCGHLAATA
jgi:DNA invertase Pin-like site-specific DNA recombinase